jgi:ribosomal-protein-alanine N-acetyltransferase
MCGEAMRNHIGKTQRRNEMALSADDFVIRAIGTEDAGALVELESRSVGSARWGEADYREIAAGGFVGWAAIREKVLLGFILVRAVVDEMEILNLAVEPNERRKGIAERLVAQSIDDAKRANVKRVYLEVRESNSGARAFYASMKFEERWRRKNYYSQPTEHALVLMLRLG